MKKRSVKITSHDTDVINPMMSVHLLDGDDTEQGQFLIPSHEPARLRDIVYLWLSGAGFEVIKEFTNKLTGGSGNRYMSSLQA